MLTSLAATSEGASVDKSPEKREMLTDYTNGEALAQEFLTIWQQAHGAPKGTASALIGTDSLAVLLERAFSRAEHSLSRQSDSPGLLQQYIQRLVDQIAPNLAGRVEQVTGRRVLTTSLNTNIEQDWVIIFFKLGDVIKTKGTRDNQMIVLDKSGNP